jgi:hypothetical protein
MQLSITAILCHIVMLSLIMPDYTRRHETQHNRVNCDTDWTINNVMLRVSMCRGMKYNNLEHNGTQYIGINIPFYCINAQHEDDTKHIVSLHDTNFLLSVAIYEVLFMLGACMLGVIMLSVVMLIVVVL